MFRQVAYAAAAAAALISLPASAATTVTYHNPGGTVVLNPAGPGAVAGIVGFDLEGQGSFTAIFNFSNPYDPAAANASVSFNFDPDKVTFTGGSFSGGTSVTSIVNGMTGSSIQVDLAALPFGSQTLTLTGALNPQNGGNRFASLSGTLTLVDVGTVPEPATWALFILGFGAIGHTMRRRSSQVRIAKASLNFA